MLKRGAGKKMLVRSSGNRIPAEGPDKKLFCRCTLSPAPRPLICVLPGKQLDTDDMKHWFKIESTRNLILILAGTLTAAFAASPARAANITLQGLFAKDDGVQLFDFGVTTAGSVDLRSYGYAGGRTSTGTIVPVGGFETILTLFDSSGNLLSENDDGTGVATDPSTGLAGDSRITATLNAGRYVLALTQYDNFARGKLAEGFVETGHPNFTADPNFTTGGPVQATCFATFQAQPGDAARGVGRWTLSA